MILDPRSRPRPDCAALIRTLREHAVDWVLSGSAVLALYGARLDPADVDVVPATDEANLRRLAGVLESISAIPAFHESWSGGMTLDQCLAWTPQPPTAEHLDHLYVTDVGMVDVPPSLTGTYQELQSAATSIVLGGVPVSVCDPRAVLERLPEQPRAKDVARAAEYQRVRNAIAELRLPVDCVNEIPESDRSEVQRLLSLR